MKVAVTGSIAYDYLMSFPGVFSEHFIPEKLDSISVSFLVDDMKKRRGGTAANIAYNLALLGGTPLLIGIAGRDFPDYGDALRSAGVDLSGVRVLTGEYTPSFFASTDEKGNQIAFFAEGAMKQAADVSLKQQNLPADTVVVISPNAPSAMNLYVQESKELGLKYVFDPGQQIVRLSGEELLAGIDGAYIAIMNDYELGMTEKKTGLNKKELAARCDTMIVTLGEKGSEIVRGKETVSVLPVKAKQCLDPTGVGDAFRAGLLCGLMNRFSWKTAGCMGSLAATCVLETDGPQNHTYTPAEFVQRFKEAFPGIPEIDEIV